MLDFLRGLLAMNSLHLGAPAMRACLCWQCRSRVLPSAKAGCDYLLSPACCACSSSFAHHRLRQIWKLGSGIHDLVGFSNFLDLLLDSSWASLNITCFLLYPPWAVSPSCAFSPFLPCFPLATGLDGNESSLPATWTAGNIPDRGLSRRDRSSGMRN